MFGFLIKQDKWVCACWNPQARAENLKTLSETSGKLEINPDKEQQVLAKVSGKGEGSGVIQKNRI